MLPLLIEKFIPVDPVVLTVTVLMQRYQPLPTETILAPVHEAVPVDKLKVCVNKSIFKFERKACKTLRSPAFTKIE